MPSVPNVATNGGSPSATTSTPLATPNATPTPTAAASPAARPLSFVSERRHHDAAETQHRAHRQVDALRHDDERHRQRKQQQHRRLDADVEDVGQRRKPVPKIANTTSSTTSRYAAPGMVRLKADTTGLLMHRQLQDARFAQLRSRELADDALVAHHVRAIADRHHLRQL